MRATIKDIAKETGLSITTVSLVLNNKGGKIPESTKRLIFDTVKKLNYRPNFLAKSLHAKKTNTIGLIIPDISNIFFSELAKGVEDCCRKNAYNVILCNSNDEYQIEQQSIDILADRRVDGILIVMSSESFGEKNELRLASLYALGIPVVLVDCFDDTGNFSSVVTNNRLGAYLAVQHLLDLGHKKIGCITGPQKIKTNKERVDGYKECLIDAKINLDENLICEGDFRYQSGYNGALNLIKRDLTAIFCHNDMMALGALNAVRDRGYKVPGDFSIMGFDDIFFSQYLDTPLSTVNQSVYKMGLEASLIMFEEIKNSNQPKKNLIFTPHLVIRQSTAAPRIIIG
jgi:LacI family transcriptional regulator